MWQNKCSAKRVGERIVWSSDDNAVTLGDITETVRVRAFWI
jgi:hypothetical protein